MKKNVASQAVGAQLIAKADGTPVTTGTTTVYVTGDGGTQAAGSVGSGACTHEGNGFWTYAPAQAETNYDHAAFTFVNTSAVNATVQVYTSYPQTGDSFARLGAPTGASVSADVSGIKTKTDFLPSATAGAAGGLFIAGTNAATTITTSLTTTFTGNLTGSVGSVTGAVGSVTGNVGGNVTGSVGSIATGGIAAASFAAGAINAAAIATNAIDADALATDAVTEIQSGLATSSSITTLQTAVNDLPTNAELATALDALPTAAENADAVWDEAIAGHAAAGSTGEALSDAGGSGTPPTPAEIADGILARSLAGGADGGRTVQDALRSLRNKSSITGGVLTVCEEDDTATAWTAAVTTTPGDPLSAIDPA